ncbi:MAG: hypothetical protein A2Z34_08500 [Planctomycetes bacterium RBG_16_59_8]|nr:MAG: hypothetical protein A2Z34_08500 [Planctomycetes bacterium RBG_16_59_8]
MRRPLPLFLLLLLAGCRIADDAEFFRVTDRQVDALIASAPGPERSMAREIASSDLPRERAPAVVKLDAVGGVNLALKANRKLLETIEKAFLARIDSELAESRYWPILQPFTVSSSMTDSSDSARSREEAASVGISQRLPLGGSVDFTGTGSAERVSGAETYKLTPAVGVTIPLWKGAGLAVTYNDLLDAAASARYATRELEHFKQVLVIDIVRQYFSLLQQRKSIANLEKSLENARKLRNQSDALYRFGRVTKTELFRAEYQQTQAENDLLNAAENLKIAEDIFKLELALPPETTLELAEEGSDYLPVAIDETAYIDSVREGNILWRNTQERFEESKRHLSIAARELDPQLDLTGKYSAVESSEDLLKNYESDPETWSAMLALKLPLDRKPLRTTYRHAVISYLQDERSFARSRDELVRQARLKTIGVRQSELNVRLQKRGVEVAEKALKLLNYEYRQGKVANRDVIEAQNRLIAAQNALLRSLVEAKISQLELKQLAGGLAIDEEGTWLKK